MIEKDPSAFPVSFLAFCFPDNLAGLWHLIRNGRHSDDFSLDFAGLRKDLSGFNCFPRTLSKKRRKTERYPQLEPFEDQVVRLSHCEIVRMYVCAYDVALYLKVSLAYLKMLNVCVPFNAWVFKSSIAWRNVARDRTQFPAICTPGFCVAGFFFFVTKRMYLSTWNLP